MGTVATDLAVRCRAEVAEFAGADIVVVPALGAGVNKEAWASALAGTHLIVTIEDDPGALRSAVCSLLIELQDRISELNAACAAAWGDGAAGQQHLLPKVVSRTIDTVGPSFRTLEPCLEYFGFTPQAVRDLAFADEA